MNSKIETRTAGLTVTECLEQMRMGLISSVQLVQDCLDIISATDPELQAWEHVDSDGALEQARQCDNRRKRGLPTGSLNGIPVGIKDIVDVKGIPTRCGSDIHRGRVAEQDASLVENLRLAGAVILGKTVTTEFAFMHPSPTRNPHDSAFSPGGSSSGSAAAVGAGQIPLAIGTQTNGSVIRPASYCGVYGCKPSMGVIPRRGVLKTSQTLDQIGGFARDAESLALLMDAVKGHDRQDPASFLHPRPDFYRGLQQRVPIEPKLALIDLDYADRYQSAVTHGLSEIENELGEQVDRIPAPRSFSVLVECQRVIHHYEIYHCLEQERNVHGDSLSGTLQAILENAAGITRAEYLEALDILKASHEWFDEFFNDYDAILTPSATGIAPEIGSDAGTGDPICNTIWTLAGLPCVGIPLLLGENELPIGIQVVGSREGDDRLFRTTRWMLEHLSVSDASPD